MDIFDSKDRIVDANYDDEVAPIHKGNPFIEALPRYKTPEQIIDKLRRRPAHRPEFRHLPDDQRLDMLPEIEKVYQPLERDVVLFGRLFAQVKACYAGRLSSDSQYFQKSMCWREGSLPSFLADQPEGFKPKSMLISAIGGTGKTTSSARWLSLIPQAIRHTSYKEHPFYVVQVPYIRLDCHVDGEPRSLCQRMIRTLDALLGTSYALRYIRKSPRPTVAELMENVSTLFHLHGVVLIVIDHMESMNAVKSGGAGYLSNFIYELSSQIGATVLFIGTPDSGRFVTKTFRQLRRVAELGSAPWGIPPTSDRDKILQSIWRYQLTREKTELSQLIKNAMYKHTLGIPSLDAALYQLVQERAINSRLARGDESITVDLINAVAHDSFYLLEDVQKVLMGTAEEPWHRFPDLPIVEAKGSAHQRNKGESDQENGNNKSLNSRDSKQNSESPQRADLLIEENNKENLDDTNVHEALKEQGVVADIDDLLS
jgi:hypothetical protein